MTPRVFVWRLLVWGLCSVQAQADQSCEALPRASAPEFQPALQAFLDNGCYKGWQHDPAIRTTNGVHPNVQVYYSPSLWQWMTTGKRRGDAPEAAMLVKAQYSDTAHPDQLTDWAIMVKDQTGAWDGWYWADLSPSASQAVMDPPPPPRNGPNCAPAEFPSGGFGQYCINCHASAGNGQNTFATKRFVLGGGTGLPLSNVPRKTIFTIASPTCGDWEPRRAMRVAWFPSRMTMWRRERNRSGRRHLPPRISVRAVIMRRPRSPRHGPICPACCSTRSSLRPKRSTCRPMANGAFR